MQCQILFYVKNKTKQHQFVVCCICPENDISCLQLQQELSIDNAARRKGVIGCENNL